VEVNRSLERLVGCFFSHFFSVAISIKTTRIVNRMNLAGDGYQSAQPELKYARI